MQPRRILANILKLWVLAMIAGALYFLWQDRATPPLASEVEAAEQVRHTNVEVSIGTIEKKTLHICIVGYGNVEPEPATAQSPAADARITLDWPAVVSQVSCVEGRHVTAGQTLFISKNLSIVSPIDGTVIALNVHAGEVALPTTTAVEVVDLKRLVVAASIPAWEGTDISAGQSAQIKLPGTTQEFEAKVQRVDPAADPKNSLVSADVAVPADSPIRLGQLAQVNFATKEIPDALVVPADAIVRDSQDAPFIGIVSDDRKQAILKPVKIGVREGDSVQVIADSLSAGQTIVTGGAYGLLFRTDVTVLNP